MANVSSQPLWDLLLDPNSTIKAQQSIQRFIKPDPVIETTYLHKYKNTVVKRPIELPPPGKSQSSITFNLVLDSTGQPFVL